MIQFDKLGYYWILWSDGDDGILFYQPSDNTTGLTPLAYLGVGFDEFTKMYKTIAS